MNATGPVHAFPMGTKPATAVEREPSARILKVRFFTGAGRAGSYSKVAVMPAAASRVKVPARRSLKMKMSVSELLAAMVLAVCSEMVLTVKTSAASGTSWVGLGLDAGLVVMFPLLAVFG